MATFQTPEREVNIESRLQLETYIASADHHAVEAADRREVLSRLAQPQKTLPAKYFYDARGSELFEEICGLPEYYPTRTEAWILDRYAGEIASATGLCELVELGSGSSTKTRALLDSYCNLGGALRYSPIDVSRTILTDSARQLLRDYPTLRVRGAIATYDHALASLPPTDLPSRMLVFLGSSLGNLTPGECDRLFDQVQGFLDAGEYFLLGVDLHKSTAQLEAAYNDSRGVTAEFNLNVLAHLNRRFGANFDRANFEHWAFYNEGDRQIELHLRCLRGHEVTIGDRSITFTEGETIRTEISRKFDVEAVWQQLDRHDLEPINVWRDPQNWFASILSRRRVR
ncbi:MAG: L-histidine N(alpha)-methyltransferase [Cyanophyceae cyanobacterium]